MASPIECLPVEVFDNIAFYLGLPGYNGLRLSSRRLRSLTFSTFAKRFFSYLTATLGPLSLQRLINVSNHPHLAKIVTVLDIRLLNHQDYEVLTSINRVGIFPPPKRFPRISVMTFQAIDEESKLYDLVIKNKGVIEIAKQLYRAFRSLSNLKSIHFRTRSPDPLSRQSKPMHDGDCLFRTRCFEAVISAIIQSEIQLQELIMAKGERNSTVSRCVSLPHAALTTLSLDGSRMRSLHHSFQNLQSLTLSIVSADHRMPGREHAVSKFINAAPLLRHLTLILDRKDRISQDGANVVQSLAAKCQLPRLSSFHLSTGSATEDNLKAFLLAHPTSLEQVVLSDIHLIAGNWSSLCLSLKSLERLEMLRLSRLLKGRDCVLFHRCGKDRFKITLDKEKEQQAMSDLLESFTILSDFGAGHLLVGNAIEQG